MKTITKTILTVLSLTAWTTGLVEAAPQAVRDKEQQTLDSIQGRWQLESRVADGSVRSDGIVKRTTIEFQGQRMSLVEGDHEAIKADIEIFHNSNPKRIVLTIAEGPSKGKQIEGIIKIFKNSMRLCVSIGGPQPTSFTSSSGSTNEVFNLRRVKPIEEDGEEHRWHHVSLAGQDSVSLPTEAETRKDEVDSEAGPLKVEFFKSGSFELKLMCQIAVIETQSIKSSEPSAILAVIDSVIANEFLSGDNFETHTSIQIQDRDATEMTFVGGPEDQFKGISRSIVVDQCVYVLTAVGRSDDSAFDKKAKQFLDSLNLR